MRKIDPGNDILSMASISNDRLTATRSVYWFTTAQRDKRISRAKPHRAVRLKAVTKIEFDLVLLDLMMPDMN